MTRTAAVYCTNSCTALADFLVRMGRRTDAQALILDIPTPRTASDYLQRGDFCVHVQDFDKALDDYCKALELEPDNAECHDKLRHHYTYCPNSRIRNLRLAIEHGRKAVGLEPNNAKYHARLAHTCREHGDRQAARDECTKARATVESCVLEELKKSGVSC